MMVASSVWFCCPQGAELPGDATAGDEQLQNHGEQKQEIDRVSTENREHIAWKEGWLEAAFE